MTFLEKYKMEKTVKLKQNNPETKKIQMMNMFNGISSNYDILNRIITLGIDIIWRKKVVSLVKKHKHDAILDIATGTGDLVLALAKLKTKKIIGLDISPGMLNIGIDKVVSKRLESRIEMQLGDSESLQFEDASFDVVTVAFGVRNFENLEKGLKEINRILKPKGVLVILETAVPKNQILKPLYTFYTQNIIPFVSSVFFKDHSAYQYLSDSAASFQCGEVFNNILRENGFIDVDDFPQTLGVSSIYFAKKP
tara:strand:+ start:335 stop:1090 length:756 start_codon:yes stop_codon:yes gene_type:complete